MRTAAPPEICKVCGLPEGTQIGAVIEKLLNERLAPAESPHAQLPVEWTKEDDNALFAKLVGTPAEIKERHRLRELAYTLVARTATREELLALLHGGVIDEPKPGDIIVPELRLLQ
jgi:hypothetical protein